MTTIMASHLDGAVFIQIVGKGEGLASLVATDYDRLQKKQKILAALKVEILLSLDKNLQKLSCSWWVISAHLKVEQFEILENKMNFSSLYCKTSPAKGPLR